MKQEVYDKLLQYISTLKKEKLPINIATLISSARLHDNVDLLDITYDRITQAGYEFSNKMYNQKQELEIYKSIMTYYGKEYKTDEDVEKFACENMNTDLPIKLIYNGLKNHVLTHCFNGGLLEKISKEGLNTQGEREKYEKLDKIFSKVNIEIPKYYVNHLGRVYFMRDSDSFRLNYYLSMVPEWFNVFLRSSFGVSEDDYKEKNYIKILETVNDKLVCFKTNKQLTDEELVFIGDYLKDQIDLYCKKINPGIAILDEEKEITIKEIEDIFTENIFDFDAPSREEQIEIFMHNIFRWQETSVDGKWNDFDVVKVNYYEDSQDVEKIKQNTEKEVKTRI